GDINWTDYTLTVRLTPLLGENHLILGRVQGALRSYALGLTEEGLTLYKNDHGYQKVASTSFKWEHGKSYELHLKNHGNVFTGWITNGPRLTWTDSKTTYFNGQIGLANFAGCHTRYEEVSCKQST
ncbi:MAG: hypothetical protein DRI32_03455, partial [Chloroflexi bacterium]